MEWMKERYTCRGRTGDGERAVNFSCRLHWAQSEDKVVCVFLEIAFSCSKGTDVGNVGPALSLSPQHCVSSSVCCGVVSQLAEFICILYHYCMVWFGCWDCTNMIYPIWLLYGTLLKGERASSVLLIVAFVPPNSRHLAVPLWSGIASSAAGKWGLM